MRLHSKDLILREYTFTDCDAVHTYGTDEDVLKYMLWGPNTLFETKQFIALSIFKSLQEPRDEYGLAIIEKKSNQLIGGVSLSLKGTKAEIGWILNRAHWGKGYAFQAALEILTFGFNVLKCDTIEATCDTENHKSYQLMRKLGMSLISTESGVRPARDISQKNRDQYRYEIDRKRFNESLERGDYARIV
jgi:RimJ/RimL family protein N-acetyltransferase